MTAPFPPYGENCAIMGISSLPGPTRSAGLGPGVGCELGTSCLCHRCDGQFRNSHGRSVSALSFSSARIFFPINLLPLSLTVSFFTVSFRGSISNLRQALIYIHFRPEDRILDQTVENFSHFGHAYADSTVLVGPESRCSAFFYVYAVLIVDKCVFSRFLLCFIHRFFRLNPIARKNDSVRIFRFPVEKKRRKPKSCFIRPNAPST